MPAEVVQDWLNTHPMQRQWSSLRVDRFDLVFDDDLARLRYLPELEKVSILSSRITDRGVHHLLHLKNLKTLVILSRRVTNACLTTIADLRSLEILDLQLCPRVSSAAFASTVKRLPKLQESFPPWGWFSLGTLRYFYYEWRALRRRAQVA